MALVAATKARAVLMRDKEHCRYCGIDLSEVENTLYTGWTIDHIVPRSRGGGNDIENLALACPRCNNLKASHTLEEFAELLDARIKKMQADMKYFRQVLAHVEVQI